MFQDPKLILISGLNGKIHNELLKSLSAGLPPIIVEKLMEKLACREVGSHLLHYHYSLITLPLDLAEMKVTK